MMQLQVALDVTDPEKAFAVARHLSGMAVRLEVGTPLLIAGGIGLVGKLRSLCPGAELVADTKICDAGERIAALALAAGADVITIVPAAADAKTWAGVRKAMAAQTGLGRPGRIMADLIGSPHPVRAGLLAVAAGADELCLHLPRRAPGEPLDLAAVRELVCAVQVPVFVAGGLQPADGRVLSDTGIAGLIVGGAITEAPDPAAAVRAFGFDG